MLRIINLLLLPTRDLRHSQGESFSFHSAGKWQNQNLNFSLASELRLFATSCAEPPRTRGWGNAHWHPDAGITDPPLGATVFMVGRIISNASPGTNTLLDHVSQAPPRPLPSQTPAVAPVPAGPVQPGGRPRPAVRCRHPPRPRDLTAVPGYAWQEPPALGVSAEWFSGLDLASSTHRPQRSHRVRA